MGEALPIEFRVLGPVQAYDGDAGLPLGGPKQRAVLVELLLARGALVPRERLVDAVWGESPPGSALASLQVYVHGLRKAIGAARIETHGRGYRLPLEPDELDLERFERSLERGSNALEAGDAEVAADELRAALALWHGPALADLAGEPVARRAAPELEDRRLRAVELRNDAELALGRHDELLDELAGLVAEHPYRERLREQLILALYRAGRQKDALDAYRAARRALLDELGVEPGPGLRELERRVLRQDAALAAPARVGAGRARLPVPPTPLVGRRLESAAVAALLRREDVRLVTLTGPGGTGKTRLALAAAAELAAEWPGGAAFVDLSTVSDPTLVSAAVAQTLGVSGGDPAAEVVEALRARPALLVLDNLEQLLPDVPFVAALLSAVERVRVLATSRAPLRLSAEHEYPVPPLRTPAPRAAFEELVANDAVRLFAARVQAVDPGFELDDGNVASVASICRRLDGLPLALELAAARARVLAPRELEERLGGALELLVAGARDLPPRQRTLRATLDWSYALLSPEERDALARVAVFAGGCTAGAAEVVIAGDDPLGRLAALVESSLLLRGDGPGAPRFGVLETIRSYGLERLREAGDEAEIRGRHRAYFLALAERLGESLLEAASEDALRELDADRENVLAALAWAAETGDVETEVRLAAALRPYWNIRGELAEARRFFEPAIAHSAGRDPRLHATALVHGAVFAYRAGDAATARAEWEEALELFRGLGDDAEVARCTGELGAVAYAEGDLDRAEELWRESIAANAALGNSKRQAVVLDNLASLAAERGDLPAAVAESERALAIQREIDDPEGMAVLLLNFSRRRLALGDAAAARALLSESLATASRLGYREVIAYGLATVAELVLPDGRPETAARLVGASDALFEATGLARAGDEHEARERTLASARERLGADRAGELHAAGSELPLEEAVAEALRAIA